MDFPHGVTVERLRAKTRTDRYSQKPVATDWSDPDVLTIANAFVAQSSTSRSQDVTRTQMLELKSLYCAADADVQPADRIRAGGIVYEIEGVPAADVNPFTGWQPIREIPLRRDLG